MKLRKVSTASGRKAHPNTLKALKKHEFKPGEEWTGNAGGRPGGSITISELQKQYIFDPAHAEEIREIVKESIARAKKSGLDLDKLQERTEGKVPDGLKHSGTINLVVEYREGKVDDDVAYDS